MIFTFRAPSATLLASLLALSACVSRVDPSMAARDFVTSSSDLEVGKGPPVEPGDRVTVRFVEGHSPEAPLDSSGSGATAHTFNVGSAGGNGGLNSAVLGMQVGGRRRFVVSSTEAAQNLATAPGPNGTPGAVRVLDITLVSIGRP